MLKSFLSATTFLSLIAGSAFAKDAPFIGVVNFSSCVTDSKTGKKEQENMENLRRQMASLMENSEKELREISAKFEDTEYLDSLTPKAEEDLKVRYQALQEELGRYQQQFYQVLNHANYQLVHKMSAQIAAASEKIATDNHLDYVINREACFYVRSDFDVTPLIIQEMDKTYDLEAQNQAVSNNAEETKAG